MNLGFPCNLIEHGRQLFRVQGVAAPSNFPWSPEIRAERTAMRNRMMRELNRMIRDHLENARLGPSDCTYRHKIISQEPGTWWWHESDEPADAWRLILAVWVHVRPEKRETA